MMKKWVHIDDIDFIFLLLFLVFFPHHLLELGSGDNTSGFLHHRRTCVGRDESPKQEEGFRRQEKWLLCGPMPMWWCLSPSSIKRLPTMSAEPFFLKSSQCMHACMIHQWFVASPLLRNMCLQSVSTNNEGDLLSQLLAVATIKQRKKKRSQAQATCMFDGYLPRYIVLLRVLRSQVVDVKLIINTILKIELKHMTCLLSLFMWSQQFSCTQTSNLNINQLIAIWIS